MLMAQRLQMLGLRHIEVFASQPVPQPLAPNRSPQLAGLLAVKRQQFIHGSDSLIDKPLLRACADAGQIAQRELAQGLRQNVQRQRHQAVGFLHVAGHLGQITVGRQTDGAAHHGAHLIKNSRLHPPAQLHRRQQRPFPAHQPAGHLVDREYRCHRQTALNGLDDAAVVLHVKLVARLHQHQFGTHAFGVGDHGSCLHAVRLGLVTGGNADGCVGHHRHHSHRAATKLRPRVLFH